ncbi:MAG: Flp family type IVb pilin [Novosphingobium sp.]
MTFFKKLVRNEDGATAIEYGLIAALIAVAIMTTVGGLGSTLNQTFSKTSSGISSANAA